MADWNVKLTCHKELRQYWHDHLFADHIGVASIGPLNSPNTNEWDILHGRCARLRVQSFNSVCRHEAVASSSVVWTQDIASQHDRGPITGDPDQPGWASARHGVRYIQPCRLNLDSTRWFGGNQSNNIGVSADSLIDCAANFHI